MEKRICAAYFSATGTTKKTVCTIGNQLAKRNHSELIRYDFTHIDARNKIFRFHCYDVVVFGVPVYAGRVPNVVLKFIKTMQGKGALAIPIVSFGNRDYDDSLIELRDLLEATGFHTIAAGAFIGEHAFSYTLAKGRPDEEDVRIASDFGDKIADKLERIGENTEPVEVRGEVPYRPYYIPKDRYGKPVNILKDRPKTKVSCINCKLCVKVCPMHSISFDDVKEYTGICIKCGACVKKCPVQARYYDSVNYLYHKKELELVYQRRALPEIFL